MLKLERRKGSKKGTWRIRGSLGGRRYDESTGTHSRPHAEAILAKRQKDILDALTWGPEKTTTFAQAIEIYLGAGGEARFLEPLVLAFGPRRLMDITQADLLKFIAQRYPTTGVQGLFRQVYTPMIAVFHAAQAAQMGPPPPFKRPKLPARAAVNFPTDAQLAQLMPACSPRLRAAILLMSYGGARVGEACRVVEADVNFETARVMLRETKNGSPRVISAGPVLMHALGQLRGAEGRLFGFSGRHSLNQALERACKRAGLPVFTSHEVGRHAFAARHLAAGRTLLQVQKLGGWKSYRMVAEVYGHLEQSNLDEMMRETGADMVQAVMGADNVVPLKRMKE